MFLRSANDLGLAKVARVNAICDARHPVPRSTGSTVIGRVVEGRPSRKVRNTEYRRFAMTRPRRLRRPRPAPSRHVSAAIGASACSFPTTTYPLYRDLLREACDKAGVSVWAYCLMPNHVHLILTPATADGLARALGEGRRRTQSWTRKC